MECSCTIDNYCDDHPDYTIEVLVDNSSFKASRERVCMECGALIEPGEPHYHMTYWEEPTECSGGIHRLFQCGDCHQVVGVFFEGYQMGGIWNDLRTYITEGYITPSETCLIGLSDRNMERVCGFIEERWENEDDE